VVNSVTVRRVMAEMVAGSLKTDDGSAAEGGSKRVQPRTMSLLRGRGSWPKIRAF